MTELSAAGYLIAILACAVAVGAAASRWTHANVLDRALVSTTVGIGTALGAALLLGMVGLLSAVPYLVVMVAAGAAAAVFLLLRPGLPQRVPAAWSFSGIAALVSGLGFAALALAPAVRGRPSGHHETRNYHIANLTTWWREHSIWPLPYQNPGFFTATHPGNGELIAIGTLFATQGDHFTYSVTIAFGALAVLATAVITRELGGRADYGALAAIAAIGAPLVFGTQAHSLATDIAATAGLVAGVAALIRGHRDHDHRWVAVGGLALGLALGTKYTMLLMVPIVVVGAIAWLRPRRHVLWLAPGIVVFGAPWLVRNLVATGTPIFPQQVEVFGVVLLPGGRSPLLALDTTIFDHVLAGRWDVLGRWARLVAEYWGPIGLILAAAVVGIVLWSPRRTDRLLMAGFVAVAAFVYLVTPYTGAGPDGLEFLMGSNIRYTMPAVMLGIAVAGAVLPSRILLSLVGVSLIYNVVRLGQGYGWRSDLGIDVPVALGATAFALAAAAGIGIVGRKRIRVNAPLLVGGVAACLAVAAALSSVRMPTPSTPLVRVLDELEADDVTAIGVNDVRSLLGEGMDTRVEGIRGGGLAGEEPLDATELSAAVETVGTDAIVVLPEAPGVPDGWSPQDGWQRKASTPQGDVYVRAPELSTPSPEPPDVGSPAP